MLRNIELFCVIKLHEVKKFILVLGLLSPLSSLASSLEIFLVRENYFLNLPGLQFLKMKHFWYFVLRFSNFLSESYIVLKRDTAPLKIFSILLFGEQVEGSIYMKVLVVLVKICTEMWLDSLSNVSLRFRNPKKSFATSMVN